MINHTSESVCYKFPSSTSQCNFDRVSLFLGISGHCNIVINPPQDFDNFKCYRKFNLFKVNVNISSRLVCLSDWKGTFNNTVVHFLCLNSCTHKPCNIYSYISSHQVVMST